MIWRIEIKYKRGVFDAKGESIEKDILDFHIKGVSSVHTVQIYNIEGEISDVEIQRVACDLLSDPVTQEFRIYSYQRPYNPVQKQNQHIIEIAYNPGVMDPVEYSTLKGIKDLGIPKVSAVRTARQYILKGKISAFTIETIVQRILANKLIQHVVTYPLTIKSLLINAPEKQAKVVIVELSKASQEELKNISEKGQLFLNIDEMKAIQKYFKSIGREPTDCELETIAQTWSEHCFHKTFRGNIEFEVEENGKKKKTYIKNLLKSTIVKATEEINKSWCVSVFHDNAGVIKFDDESHVCFKVETHNHPSALEPYGGANTGIGGVIRDILGTGLGAKPICSTDVFCFAPPDLPTKDLPPGTLHPKRIMKGVVSGVRDYGNKMGIPTINGSICFDKRYVGNPLVYCGSVGIMPKDKVKKKVHKGDLIVVAGGRTGRDGIHGATFSSGELTTESETVSSGAVQIGDPIQEKKVADALLQARDLNLYHAITDCGAGGLSSAVGEMGEQLGARVDLHLVPLKYQGLTYEEIWISESQERMVMAVGPGEIDSLLELFETENVEAVVIGEFTGTKRLEIYYHELKVSDLEMKFLFDGNPRVTKSAVWKQTVQARPKVKKLKNFNDTLHQMLSHFNVCSKEWVVRQYDHEVQGGSIIKPLVGRKNDGPSDASVIIPKLNSCKGIAVSNGINPNFGMIDPKWMAASCIDEAIRQIICVGGDLEKIAILDNFCWGNPDKPDRLGGLVRAAQGCYEAAVAFQVPFISGKDSLYNEYTEGKKSIAIPGTLLISAIGIIKDIKKTITMDVKDSGNLIYILGETFNELGGSIYLSTLEKSGGDVPKVDYHSAVRRYELLNKAIDKGYVCSAHDCSEGGIAVALAEMAFSGGFGLEIDLSKAPRSKSVIVDDVILFSESNSRIIVEVQPQHQKKFESLMEQTKMACIGTVQSSPEFNIHGINHDVCVNANIADLKESWQKPLRWS